MKKTTVTAVVTALLIAATACVFAAGDIAVEVNGAAIDFSKYSDATPYIENDRVLVPVRAIAETLGLDVGWNGSEKTVSVKGDDTEIKLTINSSEALVNGESKQLDAPARISENRTFVPLRFVSENLGAEVEWLADTRTVSISGEIRTPALAKIDNTKWQYNEDDGVYWQVGISYCAKPASEEYETLGVFVPAAYMNAAANGDGTYSCEINAAGVQNGYTAASAPIVIPVETPGYSAMSPATAYVSSASEYTKAGFVYVYAGARGRNEGAPAGVTDFKAAIRYIRYNGSAIAGDKDSIFSFGMSGGGAQSALIGATGNSELYRPYLEAIGAADESDAVKGSMCWCPITGLDIANEAYEWNLGVSRSGLDSETQALSDGLAAAFADYVNEIKLKSVDGTVLLLEQNEDGKWLKGTYYDYVKAEIERSLNNFLSDTKFPYTKQASGRAGGRGDFGGAGGGMGERGDFGGDANLPIEAVDGIARTNTGSAEQSEAKTYETAEEYIAELNGSEPWISYDAAANKASISSVEAFVLACKNASKSVGAFDDLNASQGENTLFGYGDGSGAHFDAIMAELLKDTQYGEAYASDLARTDALGKSVEYRLNMYTPLYYTDDMYDGKGTADVAKYFRIRTGINQGDTALSTEINLALSLLSYGSDVDFEMVWGQGHTKAERGDQTENSSSENFISWVNDCVKR